MAKHFPYLKIRTEKKARNPLHKQVSSVLLQGPEFHARHAQFQTKVALSIELVDAAIWHQVPCGVVVFDAWYLAEHVVRAFARRRKDWVSLVKQNRLLETASFHLRDANSWPLKLPRPHIAVEEIVPLIPANANRAVKVQEQTSSEVPI